MFIGEVLEIKMDRAFEHCSLQRSHQADHGRVFFLP